MRRSALVVALAFVAGAACDAGETKLIGAEYCAIPPAPPPASLGVNAFYGKYLDANGIPVLSSSAVSDLAVTTACTIVTHMLSARDDVRRAMIGQVQSVAILGRNEVTTEIPEYRNLYQMFQGQEWDALRGVGATLLIPVSSAGEENLLCEANDPFVGEKVLVQTFATAVLLGAEALDSTLENRLKAAYNEAKAAGLWTGSYAQTNPIEYYAVGTEAWFDANAEASPPDGTHNEINTRVELLGYDPGLAALVAETMPDDAWRPACP